MLDRFLKVALSHSAKEQHELELVELMKKLPNEQLYKLATGEMKLSGEGLDWIDKFKGTPLFEQAVQLEQESIQNEVAQKQTNAQNQAGWDARDQVEMKKRLLSLQLAQTEQQAMGQPVPAPTSAPAEASPESSSSEGAATPEGASANGPPTPKGINIKLGADLQFAVEMGRELAQNEISKVAYEREAVATSVIAGRFMAKQAAGLGTALQAAKSAPGLAAGLVGQRALQLAKANPGAVIGGGLGLMHGMRKDERGQRHLLGGLAEGAAGAIGGGALGRVAQGTHSLMGQGLGFKDALTTSGGALADQVRAGVGNMAANARASGQQLLRPATG